MVAIVELSRYNFDMNACAVVGFRHGNSRRVPSAAYTFTLEVPMSWNISSAHIELGRVFLLDWSHGVLFQIPCVGFGVWIGKFSEGGRWEVVCEAKPSFCD